jgi:hypothetical protein
MVIKLCKICKKAFVADKASKYCSRKCASDGNRGSLNYNFKEKVNIVCEVCKCNFKTWPSKAITAKYCSRHCYHEFKKTILGDKHHNWKGGINMSNNGYLYIYQRSNKRSDKKGYMPVHIFVAEIILGRPLNAEEIIHHINEIKTDNNPNNLYLFESATEHRRYHMLLRYGRCTRIDKSNLFHKSV